MKKLIRIHNLKIKVTENEEVLAKKIKQKLHVQENYPYIIRKRSIDARNKKEIYYVYEIDVLAKNEDMILKKNKDLTKSIEEKYVFPYQTNNKECLSPIIIGCGPAGLFCGYFLALAGFHPILIDRGESIEKRVKTVEEFWASGKLKENSNVQFGEGGAGTFSDGKLNTMIKDKKHLGASVLELFVKFGAPEEILYDSKPHIGTDLLQGVIKNMREEIIRLGGRFYYETTLTDIEIKENKLCQIEINHEHWIDCKNLVLAIGHSARDTFELLLKRKVKLVPKPFAVGVRIEHSKDMINKSQYGELKSVLPPASYKLTYTTKQGRGVYTFCMCPGGYVVNSSSEKNHLVINGMSNYQRESPNSNSAIIVTVTPKDFGTSPLDGVKFQKNLEQKAYELGHGSIPSQRLEDFYENQITKEFTTIKPVHKGATMKANLQEILPSFICDSIKEALVEFGKKIEGFDSKDAILSAVESRSSSPVRIERNDYGETNIAGIFPCGEGSGYSGGITSSAIDGIKAAEWVAQKITK